MASTIRRQSRKQLESTAYHEAGHAVAALALGRGVKCVSIVPGEEILGHCAHHKLRSFQPDIHTNGRTLRRIEQSILILLAGGEAEAKFRGRHNHIGAERDYQDAIDLAMCVFGSEEETEAYLRWLLIRARNLITSLVNWPIVEHVAAELLARKTLNGREMREEYQIAREKLFSG